MNTSVNGSREALSFGLDQKERAYQARWLVQHAIGLTVTCSRFFAAVLFVGLPIQSVCAPVVLTADGLGTIKFGETVKQALANQALRPVFMEDEQSPNGRCAILRFPTMPGARFLAEGPSNSSQQSLKITAASVDRTIHSALGPTVGDPASSIIHLKSFLGSSTVKIQTNQHPRSSATQSALVFFLEGQKISQLRAGLLPAATYNTFSCREW